jgi:hypothetical protein
VTSDCGRERPFLELSGLLPDLSRTTEPPRLILNLRTFNLHLDNSNSIIHGVHSKTLFFTPGTQKQEEEDCHLEIKVLNFRQIKRICL